MEVRCSPYNLLLFFGFFWVSFVCGQPVTAQCKGDFTYQLVASDKNSPAKIEVTVSNADAGLYTFKVYEMNGTIALVHTRQASSPERVTFDNLKPSTYFVKIEWGDSCHRTLGGRDGIILTEKDQGK